MYYIEYFLFILKQDMVFFSKTKSIINFFLKYTKIYLIRLKWRINKKYTHKLVNIEQLGCEEVCLYSVHNRMNIIHKPNIFKVDKKLITLKGTVPDLNIVEIRNCKVIANTSSLISDKLIYNNYLSKIKIFHDLKNPLVQVLNSMFTKNISTYVQTSISIKNDICIHLLNEHSNNYYHLLFEVLPKYILICDFLSNDEKYSNLKYILLVDENVPQQFVEIIEYFSSINYSINYIPKYSIIDINRLIFCTDFWNSLDNTRFISNIKEDFFVDKFAIEIIKQKVKPSVIKPFRKIYFQRKKSQARYLSNTEELELFLESQGFEFVLPETLSFQEQLKLFSEAEIIIGISGAVFSNIIFMQENTSAIIFSPNTIASNYYIFQPMADVAKVNLIHILTKNSLYDSVHSNSIIDIDEVGELLEKVYLK